MSTADQIRAAIEPALTPLRLVVEDVTVSPAGKRRVVRVLVDSDISELDATDTSSAVPPLSLDTVAEATRAVSDELDATDVMGQAPYVLEVSSPGVGRALTSRDQFRRQVGRLVEVAHADGTDTGRLVEVGTDTLTLAVPATKKVAGRTLTLELEGVRRGTVHVEFRRADDAAAAGPDGELPEHLHDQLDDDTHDDTHEPDDEEPGVGASSTTTGSDEEN